jgi:hypothetical protein
MEYVFHSDAGHGWLEVDRDELVELRIADQISAYSYRRGNKVYLEEDCDASTFMNALDAKGIKPSIEYAAQEDESFIRSLPRYRY